MLISVLILSSAVRADWVEDSVVYDVTTKDGMEMAEALGHFPASLEWLNAHNLTGSSRLKVVTVSGRVAWYRWENDASCSVQEPEKVAHLKLYNSAVEYIYEAQPAKSFQLTTSAWAKDPCVGPRPLIKNSFRPK